MADPLLRVEDLALSFKTERGTLRALDGVNLSVADGEVVGLVGESGSGKSVTAQTILGLLPASATLIERGRILFRGRDLLKAGAAEMQAIRGGSIALVFQSPGSALNPLLRIGQQLIEVIRLHRKLGREASRVEAASLLDAVGLPARTMANYPHELSGGMQQRAYIAIAIACQPDLLIADEVTSSLDVSVQAQILELLRDLRQSELIRSILFITHDFGVVDLLCDRVTVLYAGRVAESASVRAVLHHPLHPYTQGLLAAIPRMDEQAANLRSIPGTVPNLLAPPAGCRFYGRCERALAACAHQNPPAFESVVGHHVYCHLYSEPGGGLS